MRSPLNSRSRFLSNTSGALVALVLFAACAACGDDECGPMGASDTGLTASSADVTIVYENLTSLAGNDCPDPDAPEGVISISIEGQQVGNPNGLLTLCIPRMDLMMVPGSGHTIGTSQSMADVRIFDMSGEDGGCTFAFDSSRPPTGNVGGIGVCDNGDSDAGFALDIDGNVSLRRTCGSTIDSVAVQFEGKIAVARRD
jgi:hypothetical protein